MAKKNESTEKKLTMVPATGNGAAVALPMLTSGDAAKAMIPAGAKKLTLPPMLDVKTIPVGGMVSGKIIALAPSISKRKDMENSKLIHMMHEDSGTEFLMPLTGVIKNALPEEQVTANIGKTLFCIRKPDGETEKYGGKKVVFMFDVFLK